MKTKFIIAMYFGIIFFIGSIQAQNPNWTVLYLGYHTYDIAFDVDGNHWLATYAMGLWNISTDEYFRPENSGMPDIRINDLYIDDAGVIWCATHDHGLVKYNGTTFENFRVNPIADSRWDRMNSVCKDNNGTIWCGAVEVYSFDGTSFTKYDYNNSILEIFAGTETIFKDKNGKLWITGAQLYSLEGNNWSGLQNPYGSRWTSAAFDSQGNIWGVAYDYYYGMDYEGGLTFYNGSEWIRYHSTDSPLPGDYITTLAIDKFDQVWIGTFAAGVAVFNGRSWAVYNTDNSQLSHNNINRIVIGPDDKVYICTDSGLNVVDGGLILNAEEEQLPTEFILHQNYPNPFNPVTKIRYSLPKSGHVTIEVYDILGRLINTLLSEEKSIGNYTVEFNALNFSSGVYFYQINTNDFSETKKMILLR